MCHLINIPERFKEKSSRRFVYFISTTIKIYVCTSHLYMSTIPVISETQQGGKPCPKKIHYTILLVSPSTSLSKTISPSIKTYWAPFKNPTPFTIKYQLEMHPWYHLQTQPHIQAKFQVSSHMWLHIWIRQQIWETIQVEIHIWFHH